MSWRIKVSRNFLATLHQLVVRRDLIHGNCFEVNQNCIKKRRKEILNSPLKAKIKFYLAFAYSGWSPKVIRTTWVPPEMTNTVCKTIFFNIFPYKFGINRIQKGIESEMVGLFCYKRYQ
jgi:hypothetical protein